AFDEGYFRPDYITMEKGGVNGLSTLPKTREELSKLASDCETSPEAVNVENLLSTRIWRAIAHYAGSALFKLLFLNFQTHRPQSASRELWGYFWRMLSRPKRVKRSIQELNRIYQANVPYFLFPLQLDSDSQVRRYSPFSGMKEAIACVLTSFAESAPVETHIIIRNHPLDNGLINYASFINSLAKACGIEERIHFVENGRPQQMINESLGVVVLNSTMGISALYQGLPVYCVGTSVYAMPGLAVCDKEMPLSDFWATPRQPELGALEDFELVLKSKALINGNFYTNSGVKLAVDNIVKTFN
ncbi:MAG: capsular biosynthesis protein, partial [Deltaproteobacteria bacterium]|nr:capsular biosynthesis protein [Deltaproteobacteria bacterium]